MHAFGRRIALVLTIIISVSGCANYQPVTSDVVQAGESVRVTTVAGETFRIRITEVTDEQLSGEQRNILREDIAALEREVEGEHTILRWVMITVGVAVLMSNSPSQCVGGLNC